MSGNGTEPRFYRATLFFSTPLSRWQSIRIRFTWHYIRQARLLYPITMWWLNRG